MRRPLGQKGGERFLRTRNRRESALRAHTQARDVRNDANRCERLDLPPQYLFLHVLAKSVAGSRGRIRAACPRTLRKQVSTLTSPRTFGQVVRAPVGSAPCPWSRG